MNAHNEQLGYVPGELDRTAPARIFLQIDTDGSNARRDEPWASCYDVTWHEEPCGGLEIQYVRADLAQGFTAGDIADQGARQFAAGYAAAKVVVTRDDDGEIIMVKQGNTIIASTCHAGGKPAAAQEAVVEYKGRRLSPEGTRECWGVLVKGVEELPRGTMLYAAPVAAQPTPAAAQEAVAWYYGFADTGEAGPVTFGGNPGAEAIEWAERHGHTLHYLYAAPVAAAPAVTDPVAAYERELAAGATHEHALHAICTPAAPANDLHAHLLHMLGAKDHEDAGRIIGELHAATMRNPAAPGIDLRQFREAVEAQYDLVAMKWRGDSAADKQLAEAAGRRDRLLALIDASPKGERVSNSDELAFAARGFLSASFPPSAEESTLAMRETYSYWHRRLLRAAGGAMDYEQATDTAADSPKGGSEAEDEDGMPVGYADWYNNRFFGMTVDTERDHWCESAWRAALRAQAGDAEVQP